MTIEQLSSIIYNNIVSGIEGSHIDLKFSLSQIEDDIINERLQIIKEYAIKGMLPSADLMIKLSNIKLLDQPTSGIGSSDLNGFNIKTFEVPQIAFVYDKESIAYIGNDSGQDSFPFYIDRHAWVNHRYKRFIKQRPHVYVDLATNENNKYNCYLLSKEAISIPSISIVAIWKDPRSLLDYQIDNEDEILNWSHISAEIIKRMTEKYLRYYRQLYQPPTPAVTNQ